MLRNEGEIVNKSRLPKNSTPFELAVEQAIFENKIPDFNYAAIWHERLMPPEIKSLLLSYLAWTFGVEIWSESMTIDQKISMIKNYKEIRLKRGTKESIKKAYQALGVTVEIEENPISKRYPRGEPFKFRLIILGQDVPSDLRDEVKRLTELLKPLRTKYDLDIGFIFQNHVKIGVNLRLATVLNFRAT